MRTTFVLALLLAACVESETGPGQPLAYSSSHDYRIANLDSGLCLDIANAAYFDGNAVNQFYCHGNQNQLWHVVAEDRHLDAPPHGPLNVGDHIVDVTGSWCLDVVPLHNLTIQRCDWNRPSQGFTIGHGPMGWLVHHVTEIRLGAAGATAYCLDNLSGSDTAGASIGAVRCNQGENQQWLFLQ